MGIKGETSGIDRIKTFSAVYANGVNAITCGGFTPDLLVEFGTSIITLTVGHAISASVSKTIGSSNVSVASRFIGRNTVTIFFASGNGTCSRCKNIQSGWIIGDTQRSTKVGTVVVVSARDTSRSIRGYGTIDGTNGGIVVVALFVIETSRDNTCSSVKGLNGLNAKDVRTEVGAIIMRGTSSTTNRRALSDITPRQGRVETVVVLITITG